MAGFALDARQANPNIDGSLAKQISDLNGSLSRNIIRLNIATIFDLGNADIELKPGTYLFVNSHIYANQITLVMVTADHDVVLKHIIAPISRSEVVISNNTHTNIHFHANGECRGALYDMRLYY